MWGDLRRVKAWLILGRPPAVSKLSQMEWQSLLRKGVLVTEKVAASLDTLVVTASPSTRRPVAMIVTAHTSTPRTLPTLGAERPKLRQPARAALATATGEGAEERRAPLARAARDPRPLASSPTGKTNRGAGSPA